MEISEEHYFELVRKADRYDILLSLYQKQLIKSVEYQTEIKELEDYISLCTIPKRGYLTK